MKTNPKKIAIVGAGLSGLSLGYWLKKAGHDLTIFEASARCGGVMGSLCEDGFVVETGPNSLLSSEPTLQTLISELNLTEEVIFPKPKARNRFIYLDGKIRAVPMSPLKFLKAPWLSMNAKLRFIQEPFCKFLPVNIPETIYDFFSRHFGEEITDKIVCPFVVGVFAGDAKKLDMRSCVPKLLEIEINYGSLIGGMIRSKNQRAQLFSFKNGTGDLVMALAATLKDNVKYKSQVESLPLNFDLVVLTTSWRQISKILNIQHELPSAPVASVSLAIEGDTVLDGFGVLIHPNEKLRTLGILNPSATFAGRAPKNQTLLTAILGGSFYPEVTRLPHEQILEIAIADIEHVLDKKLCIKKHWIFVWPEGIAQYLLGSTDEATRLKAQVENSKKLFICSQAFGGISVNDCVRKSYELAEHIGSI